jgi:hypothetical protein
VMLRCERDCLFQISSHHLDYDNNIVLHTVAYPGGGKANVKQRRLCELSCVISRLLSSFSRVGEGVEKIASRADNVARGNGKNMKLKGSCSPFLSYYLTLTVAANAGN